MQINHAIVGCGRVAVAHADAFARLPDVRLQCAMDLHRDRAERLARAFACGTATDRFADLLADPSLTSLSLTVPHDLHTCLALEAVRAGKHVLIEKPFALDVVEGRRLIDAAAQANVTAMPVAQHRFDPLVRVARDLVTSGALGTMTLVRAHLECVREPSYYIDSTWRGRRAREGGSVLINQAYHIVDLLVWLAGPVARVSAYMDARALGAFIDTEDTLTGSLVFANGALGALSVTGAAGQEWSSYLEFGGTTGLLAFDINGPNRLRRLELADKGQQHLYREAFENAIARDAEPGAALSYYGNSHRRQAQAFVDAVRGCPVAGTSGGQDALEVVGLIQAMYASAVDNAPASIRVPGTPAETNGVVAGSPDVAAAVSTGPDATTWQDVLPSDVEGVAQLLRSGVLNVASGGVLEKFEQEFAAFAGNSHCVACCNGTGAIHAALFAAGVRAGDDVLLCDYGFHGVAAAILRLGARIVPVDCLPESLTMDPDDLRRARTRRSKAVLVHNPWGVPAEFAPLREAAGDLPIISDASHAHGATYRGLPIARWADVTCFSLGFGKLITGGELGAAVTDHAPYRDRMLIYGHVNRVPEDLIDKGWNGNAVGLKLRPHVAALTLARPQLKRYAQKRALTIDTCRRMESALVEMGLRPQQSPPDSERVYWKLLFHMDDRLFATDGFGVFDALRAKRIPVETNDCWPVLQEQRLMSWPDYASLLLPRPCPVAQQVTPRTIRFPAPVVFAEQTRRSVLSVLANVLRPLRRPAEELEAAVGPTSS